MTKGTKRVQIKFPKSRKRRIRKKWAKRSINLKTVEFDQMIGCNGVYFVAPNVFKKMTEEIESTGKCPEF